MNVPNEIRAAGWYPDPYGRHELRHHDSVASTDQVSSNGWQTTDEPECTSRVPGVNRAAENRRRDLARAGVAPGDIGGGDRHAPANTPGIRRVAFAVDDIDAAVAGLRARGAEFVGEVGRYEDSYRLCYVRGPEGIIVVLAEQIS